MRYSNVVDFPGITFDEKLRRVFHFFQQKTTLHYIYFLAAKGKKQADDAPGTGVALQLQPRVV